MSYVPWAHVLSLSLGPNPGLSRLAVSPVKEMGEQPGTTVEFPPVTEEPSVAVWDLWERRFLANDDAPCLEYGSCRVLIAGKTAAVIGPVIRLTACFVDGSSQSYECHLPAGPDTKNQWELFASTHKPGDVIEGIVADISHITPAGFYVRFPMHDVKGFVHISDISSGVWIHDASDVVSTGQKVKVRISALDAQSRSLSLSMVGVEQRPSG